MTIDYRFVASRDWIISLGTKKHTAMFYAQSILTGLLLIVSNVLIGQDTRETIWLEGPRPTSHGWSPLTTNLMGFDYDFENLITTSTGGPGYDPSLGVVAAADTLAVNIMSDREGVLGIGHDYGGIILRELANGPNSGLSAMILCGTPNQGSQLLNFAIDNTGANDPSSLELLINKVEYITEDIECPDCSVVEAFGERVTNLKDLKTLYQDIEHGSPIVNNLNANPSDIPHAIFWGDIGNFSIAGLLDDYFTPIPTSTSSNSLETCYRNQLAKARGTAKYQRTVALVSGAIGIFSSVFNFTNGLDTTDNQVERLTKLGDFIGNLATPIISTINQIRDSNETLRELLLCETANRTLAVEWDFLIVSTNGLPIIDQEIPTVDQECLNDCLIDQAWGDVDASVDCETECQDDLNTNTIQVAAAPRHDGLYTEFEQSLPGEAGLYRLASTSHFDETLVARSADLDAALRDVFDGALGVAFEVPEK